MVVPGPEHLLFTRLLAGASLPDTRRTFAERFGTAVPAAWELLVSAREHAEQGLLREALEVYRCIIDRSPRDWRALGEAAQFTATRLHDPAAGLELARAAVQVNPWYSPFLWNVLGDCLAALERADEAHDCYLHACRLHPHGVETHLRLARSWLRLGDSARSLESVAQGLACDNDDMHRHHLLETQREAVEALARARVARRETLVRRRTRAAGGALPPRGGIDT
jgi:tetratricopeptide (TPR) repeat protein